MLICKYPHHLLLQNGANLPLDLDEIQLMLHVSKQHQMPILPATIVGIMKRVIIFSDVLLQDPKIISTSTPVRNLEFCICFGDKGLMINRFQTIRITYLNVHQEQCQLTLEGQQSIDMQHAIDHLDGVLMIERVSRLQKNSFQSKLT